MKNKFVVITSIFPPTEAVELFAKQRDWQLVVSGDKKTPEDWACSNVVYLSPDDQLAMDSALMKAMPWNTYARKMAGYMYAIKNGAQVIADSDDDNFPCEDWGKDISFEGEFDVLSSGKFINIYKYFTDEPVWPRGFPLNRILDEDLPEPTKADGDNLRIGVWQFLADEDPDVDAIFRLTNGSRIYFKKRPPLALSPGTLCPFNSQNTFFQRECFPLLYLPVHVNFRFTDILRGLVAQPLLWSAGFTLAFGHATALQKRNEHNYLADFESEIPCYLYPEKVIDIVSGAISSQNSLAENLFLAYEALHANGIVPAKELKLVRSWVDLF